MCIRQTGSRLEAGFGAISHQLTDRAREVASMARRKTSKRSTAKTILRLPDLEQPKNAVLRSPPPARKSHTARGDGVGDAVVEKRRTDQMDIPLLYPQRAAGELYQY